jgi:formyltetrahydrofolate deformylase
VLPHAGKSPEDRAMNGDPDPMRGVLRLSCPDRMGIVASVASFLFEHACNIVESAQFRDPDSNRFFMRVGFQSGRGRVDEVRAAFAALAAEYDMWWEIRDQTVRQRLLIMVSRFGHCLNDLLYRFRIGALAVDIPAIVSNHRDFYRLAAAHDIPFHHLPVTPEDKPRRERQLLELVEEQRCDLVVLARYMQVLSPEVCTHLQGRAINIHHSFLPSFQGARPYAQAHERGVKLIGATAHYVTAELDEGPIIEQDVARVDHGSTLEDCVNTGRDVECAVLARAVKWHVEHRVLVNGNRTVVFR